jgi:DHA1 family tetracycline resistance protein-like MFS transporter
VLTGLGSLAGIFGPPLAAWSFGACVAPDTPLPLPGVAFFEAAVLYVLALVLALRAFEADARAVRAA